MFLDKKIEIVISPSNIKHYSKFYNDLKVKDKIFVFHEELTKGSHTKIKVKCDECGNEKELSYKTYLRYGYKDGYYLCRMCKTIKNNQIKYGVNYTVERKDVRKKSKNTIKEKYGVENISQLKEVQNKKIETNLDRYGVKWGLSASFIKEKSKNTIKEKYGVENISQLEDIKERIRKSTIKKYGVDSYFKTKECRQKINDERYTKLRKKYSDLEIEKIYKNYILIKCKKCDKIYKINYNLLNFRKSNNIETCLFCNPRGVHISFLENELISYIKQIYDEKIILNSKKIISPYELDIYIPKINLAFEFNGVYWHSTKYKNKNYHKHKLNLCKNKGINLIHIWEDEWKQNKNRMKELINKLIIKDKINIKFLKELNKVYIKENHIYVVNNCFGFLFNEYKFLGELDPIKYYVKDDKRIFEETNLVLYDSGYKIFKKLKN